MASLGDFDASAVVYGKFSTYRPSTGATFTLGGTPVLSVYKDNSVTQSTSGVTLTADFDSVTGLNHFAVDTSTDGTFYAAGSFFDIVITTGTVDSVSVTGSVVASFTLRKTAALKPTTAGRALDVSAGGEAGVDWANVGSPTTSLALTGTTIAVTQKVDVDTIKTNPVANGGTVTFPTNATVASTTNITAGIITTATSVTNRVTANTDQLAGQTVTAAAGVTFPTSVASPTNIAAGVITTVTNLTNAPTTGDLTATMKTSVTTAATASTPTAAAVTGNVGGNVTGSVGSLAAQAKADVKLQVTDGLAVDTYAEPTGVPAATATLAVKLGRLHEALRNKVVTSATEKTFYLDDNSAAWKKPISDSGTEFTESEGVVT